MTNTIKSWFKRVIITVVVPCFMAIGLNISYVRADDFRLPAPGTMVHLSPAFDPPILKGIKVYPDNPFLFDFILDKGDSELSNDELKDESSKLIKYFLTSLTIPEKDLWVNLSPYEKDRIIPNSFGLTEMGRDLLAEDYMLKQITASLIYPEDGIGKKFWKRIYEEAEKKFGTTNIPVNTFNKVWIVPQKAVVYENAKAGTAYVVESRLKVMLEQDYLSLEKHALALHSASLNDTSSIGADIVREVVIPELTKEVNEDKNFTRLRQVYNSLILAAWYKKKIKDSILSLVYANKNKVAGVNIDDPKEKQKIYQRYLQAFKKGAYNYIKEEMDPMTQQYIPRKYFSGGVDLAMQSKGSRTALAFTPNPAQINNSKNFFLVQGQTLSLGGNVSGDDVDAAMRIFKNEEISLIDALGVIFKGNIKSGPKIVGNKIKVTLIRPLIPLKSYDDSAKTLTKNLPKSVKNTQLLITDKGKTITVVKRMPISIKILYSLALLAVATGFPTAYSLYTADTDNVPIVNGLPDQSKYSLEELEERIVSPSDYFKDKILQRSYSTRMLAGIEVLQRFKTGDSAVKMKITDFVKRDSGIIPDSIMILLGPLTIEGTKKNGESNQAMASFNKGGIDFNSNKMNLQLLNAGQEIKFHIDPAMLQQLQNTPGFTPVIINIQPMNNVRKFLGLNDGPA